MSTSIQYGLPQAGIVQITTCIATGNYIVDAAGFHIKIESSKEEPMNTNIYHYVVNQYGHIVKITGRPAPPQEPCPFCDSDMGAYIQNQSFENDEHAMRAGCLGCGAQSAWVYYRTGVESAQDAEKRAYAYWNRRRTDPPLPVDDDE